MLLRVLNDALALDIHEFSLLTCTVKPEFCFVEMLLNALRNLGKVVGLSFYRWPPGGASRCRVEKGS